MNTPEDKLFDRNLRTLGARIPVPDAPSHGLVSQCADTLAGARRGIGFPTFRRPGWLSTLALAASIALAFGLWSPFETSPKVEAATILAKLNEQIAEPKVIELTLDSIAIDDIAVDGILQVSAAGIAGDIHVVIDNDGDGPLEVDLALGISKDHGWVLLRKIDIPDPEIKALLGLFFPEGTETLLVLPSDMVGHDLGLDMADFTEIMEVLNTASLIEAFQDLVEQQPGTGARIVEHRDGTVTLTMPIANSESLESLIRLAVNVKGGKDVDDEDISVDRGKGEELYGSTLEIVYDTTTETVQSFSITDFGEKKGTVKISIGGDSLDPDLLDSSRVTGPNTRTIDLSVLMSLARRFKH